MFTARSRNTLALAVIEAARKSNPLIREGLIADLMTRLRNEVALSDEEASIMLDSMESCSDYAELSVVFVADDERGVNGRLEIRLKVWACGICRGGLGTVGLGDREQKAEAVVERLAGEISLPVEYPFFFDATGEPAEAMTIEEAYVLLEKARARVNNLLKAGLSDEVCGLQESLGNHLEAIRKHTIEGPYQKVFEHVRDGQADLAKLLPE